jgi:hypothetical protein
VRLQPRKRVKGRGTNMLVLSVALASLEHSLDYRFQLRIHDFTL